MEANLSGVGGKAVVITGASTGIGRSCALLLSEKGFRVFAGVRKEADGRSLREASGDKVVPLLLEVTDRESVAAAAGEVEGALEGSGLAGLVNNAGIAVAGPLEFLPLEMLEEQLRVNVTGTVAVTQAFLPLLRKSRGRVVNISSDNGKAAWPFLGAYCASKHALEALSDSLRMELRPWGIEVAVVEPGSIKTPIWSKSKDQSKTLTAGLSEEALQYYGPVIDRLYKVTEMMERTGMEPETVARAVHRALMARRPRARYVVGLDARLQILAARLVPTRLRDRLIGLAINYLGR